MSHIRILLLGCFFCFSHSLYAQNPAIQSLKVTELVKLYKDVKGVAVVNFWSTWCKPCIQEIPHFITVADKLKEDDVELVLVSQDTKDLYQSGKLERYLQKQNWTSQNVVWLDETDADYYCPVVDSKWSGVIPATIIINPAKNYYRFFEETLAADKLEAEIKKAING